MRIMDLDALQARINTVLKDPSTFQTEMFRRIAEGLADPAHIKLLETLVTRDEKLSRTIEPPELRGETII